MNGVNIDNILHQLMLDSLQEGYKTIQINKTFDCFVMHFHLRSLKGSARFAAFKQ